MYNYTDPVATVLFTTFLLRHLHDINPHIVVFVFQEKSAFQVDIISKSITGYQQLCFNLDKPTKNDFVGEDVLFINFGDPTAFRKKIRVGSEFRHIHIQTSPFPSGGVVVKRWLKRKTPDYEFSVFFLNSPMMFVGWNRSPNTKNEVFTNEQSFVQSFSWMAFLRNVTKLPEDEWLRAMDIILDDSEGEATNELAPKESPSRNEMAYVSGFRIGIFKILAEKISSSALTYTSSADLIRYQVQFQRLPPTRFRDKRLSWRYWKDPQMHGQLMSFAMPHNIKVYTHVHQTRYRILVPRIVKDSQSSDTVLNEVLRKSLVLLCFLVVCLGLGSLRYACRWLTNDRQTLSIGDLFFDTMSRLIGNSSGIWFGRSTSERQLLTVIAIAAILIGSIGLGVLYEKMFVEIEINYRYNNLEEVCRDGLKLGLTVGISDAFYQYNKVGLNLG